MILRAEDGSKAQVISSDNDRLCLAVYVDYLPALEPRCFVIAFLCAGRVEVVETRWHCAVNGKPLMFESKGPPK